MNLLILLGSVLGIGALLLAALIAAFMGRNGRALGFVTTAIGWAAIYAGALGFASWRSSDVVLEPGATKRFCGFFLDCHVGVAVVNHTMERAPGGDRYDILVLRFSSTARRETLRPWDVQIQLQDSQGQSHWRSDEAEVATGGITRLLQDIPPGGSYDVRVAFKLPGNTEPRRLLARQGPAFLLPESFMIGDEASVGHGKTWLAVPNS